jgi:hypothetical protein
MSFSDFIPLLPEGAVWIIPLSLILLLAGWISSIAIAVKSKWLVLFALFPLTNPIAVIGLMYKSSTKSMIPIGFYALAFIVWFAGSNRSYKLESKRLVSYEAKLIEQGEPIKAADYVKPQANPNENVWEHPFLKPLATAGQPGEAGKVARESLDKTYQQLQLPKHRVKLSFDEPSPDRLPMLLPARKLIELSAGIKSQTNEETSEEVLPLTPAEAATSLKPIFDEIRPDIELLEEAIYRKVDAYPFAWEQGFHMQLPHLSKIRSFSQIAHMDSIIHSTLGNSDGSFESAKLAFQLSEIGDSDFLISRLVQMAQQAIALETLVSAQNNHLWNEPQWLEIRSTLDSINMIQLMPNSLRAERSMGRSSISPLLSQTWTDAMQTISNLDGGGPVQMEGILKFALDIVGTNFSKAFLAKQWRLCLEAYSFMIEDLEAAAKDSKSNPWKDVQISWADKNLKEYGMLAAMLLPALDIAQSKAVLHQAKVELAKITIDIERYYLQHKTYPKTLDSLVPDFAESVPLDPMNGIPFAYKQLSKDSFEVYSVGLNGKDEGGRNVKKHRRDEVAPPDDLLWVIGNATKDIPSYTIR